LLAVVEAAPNGTVFIMLAYDEASNHLASSVRTAISNHFGAQLLAGLGFRYSYAMIGIKGRKSPLAEASSSSGLSEVVAELDCRTLEPTVSPGPTPEPTVSMKPTVEPTSSPTKPCIGNLVLSGKSALAASLSIASDNGTVAGFEDSWFSRGLNVVAIRHDSQEVLSTAAFDLYESDAASGEMIAHLEALPAKTVVVIVAQDEPTRLRSDDLEEYLGTAFGAQYIDLVTFQGNYVLVSFKGAETPYVELYGPRSGPDLTFDWLLPCFWPSPAPTIADVLDDGCQFVFIELANGNAINLAEIVLTDQNGDTVVPIGATISSEYSSDYGGAFRACDVCCLGIAMVPFPLF